MRKGPGPSLPTAKPQQPEFSLDSGQQADAGVARPARQDPPAAARQTSTARAAPRLCNVGATCEMLGVGRSTVFELLRRGAIEGRKLGSRTLVTVESIERFLANLPRAVYRSPPADLEHPLAQSVRRVSRQR